MQESVGPLFFLFFVLKVWSPCLYMVSWMWKQLCRMGSVWNFFVFFVFWPLLINYACRMSCLSVLLVLSPINGDYCQ